MCTDSTELKNVTLIYKRDGIEAGNGGQCMAVERGGFSSKAILPHIASAPMSSSVG